MLKLIKRFAVMLYVLVAAGCGVSVSAATCSRLNLTRCLDSVCATNIGANPAARCQLCGDAMAGEFDTNGMRTVLGGTQYSLTATELKDAPTTPGARYAWATDTCAKKIAGCTDADVADEYDKLIEQSCRAVCVNQNIVARQSAAMAASKSATECLDSVRICVTTDTRCGADFAKCPDAVLDRYLSECNVAAGNLCTAHNSDIRRTITASRDALAAGRANMIDDIVAARTHARETELNDIRTQCTAGASRDNCVLRVCASMQGGCTDNRFEQSAAELMCAYETAACARLQ